ncbi:MAG: N-acetylglutamate synthase-like GNAT family acetyltransferase [Moritella sp.]|jgi:N-acetylglutamate synthase-like GNAT family acetyltransferase
MRLSAFTVTDTTPQLLIDITKLYLPFTDDEAAIKTAYDSVISDNTRDLFVAKFNDRHIAGLIIEYDSSNALLSCIAVRDITQQRGVGKFLIQQILAQSKSKKIQTVKINKDEKLSPKLVKLLISLGFTEKVSELSITL